MIEQIRKLASHGMVALGVVLVALLSGCVAVKPPPGMTDSGNVFHVGDRVTVKCVPFSGNADVLPDHTERIQNDGTITLSLIGSVTVSNRTSGELQTEIHDRYVPKYFPGLTVTVLGETTFFYVNGEVRLPGEKNYPGQMTVAKAIAVAGGFTDFAKKTKVQLTHGGHTYKVNVTKAIEDPSYDFPVFPGDRIDVPRKKF